MLKKYFFSDGEKCCEPCVFLLGGFDGIHIGHKKLIDRAKRFSLPIGIMTISGIKSPSVLFDVPEREEIFEKLGISFVLEADFSDEFKNISADDFIKIILSRFRIKAFVCGKDFRFGKGAEGTPGFLARRSHIPVIEEDIDTDGEGRKISTSLIKKEISAGNLSEASAFLVSPFCVTGETIHGRHMGSSLSFPTANMYYPPDKTPLREGVYAVSVYIEGKKYKGIANYGRCPTFRVEYKLLETYIDGFCGDLYGSVLRVYFHFRIRDIKQFPSKEALKAQLEKDIDTVRRVDL